MLPPWVCAFPEYHRAGDLAFDTDGGLFAPAGRDDLPVQDHASDALSGPHVFGWGFNSPISVSSDGTHVWVANSNGHSVTELDATTGAWCG
jgi:DNA-binding beta-propeller fold protein YncE